MSDDTKPEPRRLRMLDPADLALRHRIVEVVRRWNTSDAVMLSRPVTEHDFEPAVIVLLDGEWPYWTRCDDESADEFRARAVAQVRKLAGSFGVRHHGPHGLMELPDLGPMFESVER